MVLIHLAHWYIVINLKIDEKYDENLKKSLLTPCFRTKKCHVSEIRAD